MYFIIFSLFSLHHTVVTYRHVCRHAIQGAQRCDIPAAINLRCSDRVRRARRPTGGSNGKHRSQPPKAGELTSTNHKKYGA